MGDLDLALDFGILGQDQGARRIAFSQDIAFHMSVDPQAASEGYIALDTGVRTDKRVDSVLRFAWSIAKEHAFSLRARSL
jgi:hypothetical protein